MRTTLVTGPTQDAVSVADIKQHLNVDFTDDDDLIQAYRDAIVQYLDGANGKLGRALVSQEWDLALCGFDPCGRVMLPLAPLLEVESVQYYDTSNVLQTLAADNYDVIGVGGHSPGYISLKYGKSWPMVYYRDEPVIVRFRAGYIDTDGSPPTGEIPAPIISAIKLMVGTLYQSRENVVLGVTPIVLPQAADYLLGYYRVY